MINKSLLFPLILVMLVSSPLFAGFECAAGADCRPVSTSSDMLGQFNKRKDLFLPQFDSKTDVDDVHSVAAVATMLSDPRFKDVKYHAVAGAYGIQEGEYVPAPELFAMAFGENWSDAHNDYETALETVSGMAVDTLEAGGSVWIAEAGQSDFSADMVRQVQLKAPGLDTRKLIHLVQHSEWNQNVTNPVDLAFVRANTRYYKIEDGNATGNGTPGFNTPEGVLWERAINGTNSGAFWKEARRIGNQYNGVDGRYLNASIEAGGLDFSDTSETCWIFGFAGIFDARQFFDEFSAD